MRLTRFEYFLLVALSETVAVRAFGLLPEPKTAVQPKASASWTEIVGKTFCSGLVAASIWSSPVLPFAPDMSNVAVAKEMASASGSRVNKDADSLLRYGLPINNKEVSDLKELYPACCFRRGPSTAHLLLFVMARFANCKQRWKTLKLTLERSARQLLLMV